MSQHRRGVGDHALGAAGDDEAAFGLPAGGGGAVIAQGVTGPPLWESIRVTTLRHDDVDAAQLRDDLVNTLLAKGMITSPEVERAFRAVPREQFVADGTPLEVTYSLDASVPIRRDANGVVISSTSAAYIQARMIEQAGLGPGMSVLEIGSGGYNAALLAEVVGRQGRVVSVDIDPLVTDRAGELLDAAGYGDRVTVVQADAEKPIPGLDEPVDAVLVTAGAWDIEPSWLDHLSDTGTLVVPLRMNGVTRVVAFRREDAHLVGTSAEIAGFVPMQGEGAGAHAERIFHLPDPGGHLVKLRFEDDVPADMGALDGVLAAGRSELWSGVTTPHGVSFAGLHLWLAAFLPGFCKVAADPGTEMAAEKGWFPFAAVQGDSFAYLTLRPDGSGAEFGARAYGTQGRDAAAAMVEQIQAWDRSGRDHEPTIAYWPTGSHPPASGDHTAVLVKEHGVATVSW
ncbi:methyltransferase, FxLD system [Streptomyces xiamenensis]|uniref:methyltransferase, FxLD system n=1 Tax=Streptomyces xiamenensis TaxID=408015 RepID=UPI0035D92642